MTGLSAILDAAGGTVKAAGGRAQFDDFVVTRWPRLVRLAYGLTGDRWLAEDLAQTALASAYAAWWRVSRADDPDAYVRRILINASHSRFRRHRLAEQSRSMAEFPREAVPDPAALLDERSALIAALGELPVRQRAVIVLRFWEDLTDAQTAAVLGCSASTVRSQMSRALAKLRARRRIVAAGGVAALTAVVAILLIVPSGLIAGVNGGEAVTINAPDPRGSGGVFASGTADGAAWHLAVRNIAGSGPWCLPAVMLNGRDGDILFPGLHPSSAILDPWFLNRRPGQPPVSFGFAQVRPGVTSVAVTLARASALTVYPVSLTQCGQRYRLAGFAYQGSRVTSVTAFSGSGQQHSYAVPVTATGSAASVSTGIWANAGAPRNAVAASGATRGKANGISWRVKVSLGTSGECYNGRASRGGNYGSVSECLPIAMPPAAMAIIKPPIPFPASGPHIAAYAGLVSPRTAAVIADISGGTSRRVPLVQLAGRKYVAFALPGGIRLIRLSLYGKSGHVFAVGTTFPAIPLGGPAIAGTSASSASSAAPVVSASARPRSR